MIDQTPLSKFIALITFDRDYEKIGARIISLEEDIVLLQEKEQSLLDSLIATDHILHTLKKEIDAYELSVKELDAQIKEKKERVTTTMNPREHRAIMAEIDALSAQQLQTEEHLLSTWNSFEARKRLYDKQSQTSEEQKQEIHTAILHKRNQILNEKSLLIEGTRQRTVYEQGVPTEWLEKYATMRSRVSNPVVPVEQDSCSACFYSMSEQELVQLRRRALLQCKGCYRFLYLPTAYQMT